MHGYSDLESMCLIFCNLSKCHQLSVWDENKDKMINKEDLLVSEAQVYYKLLAKISQFYLGDTN